MTKQTQTILYKTLARALSLARPHASVTTMEFTTWLFKHLPKHLMGAAWLDAANNLHVDARTQDHHRTLFVAHVDTVHRTAGPNKIRKTATKWYADGAALGADDGVGCALLMHLMHAGVPAYYIFTQGEECGGIGAKHIAKEHQDLLAQFDRAIAFDRRGTDSVISHQGFGRCCSDAFAQGLADALNNTDPSGNLMYAPDNTGVYTDTAEFTDIIPECTNISCGYYFEHGDKEELDMLHFDQLGAAVVLVAWDSLPTSRDPKVVEYKDDGCSVYMGKWNSMPSTWDYKDYYKDDHLVGKHFNYQEEELYEALLDAEVGFKTPLVTLMAESIYPEDCKLAKKFINRGKLTPEAVREAIDMLGQADPDAILATLFDAAYAA